MRNKYPGRCFCSRKVKSGEGYIQRADGKWQTRCMDCVVKGKVAKNYSLSENQKAYLTEMQFLTDCLIRGI